jgi:cysteine desulfurase
MAFVDAAQVAGKRPFAFDWLGAQRAVVSAHKLGGPRGVGALLLRSGVEVAPRIRGGGQEAGRRAGTENVVAIAGFGAACEAATGDLERGAWERVAELRDAMERALEAEAPDIMLVGRGAERLPNTSCFAVPGWKGETQVMQMDLAGYAVSAGSACSSGKVRPSRVLGAMGYSGTACASAVRVSMGPETTWAQIMGFVEVWTRQYKRFRQRAA